MGKHFRHDAAVGHGERIVDEVEYHARQNAAALHGQVAEDHAQQAGDQRLLEDAVGKAEQNRV